MSSNSTIKWIRLPVQVFNILEKVCVQVSMVCTAIMMFLISIDAICRYLFNSPITGTFEITEDFLMVALVFLAISYTYKQGEQVKVTIFQKFVHPSLIKVSDTIFNLAGAFFFLLLVIAGYEVFIEAVKIREFSNSILYYPMAPSYFLVPLGSAFICIRLLGSVIASLLGTNSKTTHALGDWDKSR